MKIFFHLITLIFFLYLVCNKWLHEVGQEFRRPCGPKENIQETTSR